MGGDMAAGASAGVARNAAEGLHQRRDRAPQAVDARHLARPDAHQRDEVVAVPAAVRVGLGERQAAARERPQEAIVVQSNGGRQLRVSRPEDAPVPRVDQVDTALAELVEQGA